MIDVSKIAQNSIETISTDPFPIFRVPEFFSGDVYQRLAASFPGADRFPAAWQGRGGKKYMNETSAEFGKFMNEHEEWSHLYEAFRQAEIVGGFNRLFADIESPRPDHERQSWSLSKPMKFRKGLRKNAKVIHEFLGSFQSQTPVTLRFEFSLLEGDFYLPPHTDNPNKLMSLMLYFPDESYDYDGPFGTEFYRAKPAVQEIDGWDLGMRDVDVDTFFKDHETFYTTPFEPRVLYGFVKSPNSWHGVRNMHLPSGVLRRSVNINYALADG